MHIFVFKNELMIDSSGSYALCDSWELINIF
jgi:hypothetical protein